MQKQIKIFSTLLTVLVLAVSCANTNPNDPINTAWKDNPNHNLLKKSWYDTASTDSTYNYDGTTFSSSLKGTVSYSFTVEEIVWGSDNTSGIIYGKYTANTTSPELVGKYYAVSFKSLTAESVSIAGAYKQDGVSSTDTLEEAKTTFTEANGYFSQYSDCKVYTGATIKTVSYGNKSYTGEITQAKIEQLYKESVANKTVYSTSAYTTVTGEFKADANYYETKWQNGASARTVFKRCIIYKWNGKDYIAGIYWDNKTGVGMQIRYRLIIIDEKGTEHAWYGGGSDAGVIPDENTSDWVKYNFVFGYLKLN
ncbi:hypothetical protein [Brachyspira pilosicoli]|uniref:hypothetical protein n=1 Tax=Brachyspira pilosicoli TaxID=52584 RepID=UPI001F553631|nr:hypothetical protein [Brachyspira pilosicoli]